VIAHLASLSWATRWNLVLAAPVVLGPFAVARFGGVSWGFIGAVYGGAVALALILVVAVGPAIRRSYRYDLPPNVDVFSPERVRVARERDRAEVAAIEAGERKAA
jgi:membrane protein YdbS with pleckstrin-like domain